ncbi:T9SS type A sorting domain-containing protein [Neolewinella aurantiaca]|uniref:T9SS type A sorting domain-containing protein n=1 Tax=Neolewinella aurantiaca TaxID=2602767 RepID=A0A5C7FY59_9BACT|nr:T9SS type A sorting domain-containing protein [Neolewinella aurantiaca]TXF91771.1 T9SS type A sorting domain-containing protein [Neolewinella aurantiaca]
MNVILLRGQYGPALVKTIAYAFFVIPLFAYGKELAAQTASKLVYEDASGCLRYVADSENNYLPDFSHVGYRNGDVPLPDAEVRVTLDAIEGDNTAHIQAAIDQVAALNAGADGVKGAVLLNPGVYDIEGTLHIQEDGVVLRGSGQGADPSTNTILRGLGDTPVMRDIITVGDVPGVNWTGAVPGTRSAITNPFLPAGSRSLEVAGAELYSVGDNVIVYHPSTDDWLASVEYGATDVDAPWTPGEIDIYFNRYITDVNIPEGKITLDAPIFDHFDRALAQAEIYVLDEPGIRRNIGVENLRIDIVTEGEEVENHAKNGIQFIGTEDVWVKNVTALHFSFALVDTRVTSRLTVTGCAALEPHSPIIGARRYNFTVGSKSGSVLFTDNTASDGRHTFASNGASSVGGVVFHDGETTGDYNASEGHRRWSQGLLFDNITFLEPRGFTLLGLYNRGSFGTGHGWSATNSVAWNITMPPLRYILLHKPPLRQNYAVGCKAFVDNIGMFIKPLGYVEQTNQDPLISSLFETQLARRKLNGVAPDAPARLTAVTGENSIELNWLDIASRENGYEVEYSTDGGENFSQVTSLPANTTSYVHQNPAGGELIYRVYATGPNCPSPFSNPVTTSLSVSASDLVAEGVRVYPNPVTNRLFIETEIPLASLAVHNAAGQVIAEVKNSQELDTSGWPSGLYIVQGREANGRKFIAKIIK